MILRTTLSNTKKFFQKTVESFKSFLSGGYERLPKSSPCSPFPCGGGSIHHHVKYSKSYKELDKFSAEYPSQWDVVDTEQTKNKGRSKKKEASRNDDQVCDNMMNYEKASPAKSTYDQSGTKENPKKKKKKIVYEGKRYQDFSNTKVLKAERRFLVAQRLKELEMLDNSNVEHVLDVEEVLHYYSRLTCPAYVEIVDRFFMDLYSELLNGQMPSRIHNSRPMLQRVAF